MSSTKIWQSLLKPTVYYKMVPYDPIFTIEWQHYRGDNPSHSMEEMATGMENRCIKKPASHVGLPEAIPAVHCESFLGGQSLDNGHIVMIIIEYIYIYIYVYIYMYIYI